MAGGHSDTLSARKLDTVLVSAEGRKRRTEFRRSYCAVMSWSPWVKDEKELQGYSYKF